MKVRALPPEPFRGSSMAEQAAVNRKIAGSIPARGAEEALCPRRIMANPAGSQSVNGGFNSPRGR